jgi:hypothetical protein
MMEKTSNVTELLEAFRIFDGIYKREQIDAAIELKKGSIRISQHEFNE